MLLAADRRVVVVIACAFVLLGALPGRCIAQSPAPAVATPTDSLLDCAVSVATAAGFQPIPIQRPGRLALMRPHESPGASYLLDALGLSVAPDSSGARRLKVRVSNFLVPRSNPLAQEEVATRPSLAAFADSLRSRCRS